MAQVMAALRTAAVASLGPTWHRTRACRAIPSFQQLYTGHGPSSRTQWRGPLHQHIHQTHQRLLSTRAVLDGQGTGDAGHGRTVERVGDQLRVTFGNDEEDEKLLSARQRGHSEASLWGKLASAFNFGALSSPERRKVLSEVVVQFLFNFCSCSAVAAAAMNAGGNALLNTGLVMAAHMVILPLLIFTFGPISGAHFNPMVTACFVATKQMTVRLGLAYIAAQTVGGVVGAAAAFSSLPAALQTAGYAGINAIPADHTLLQGFMGEVYASFVFISVLFGTVVDKRGWGRLGPLSVGLIVPLLMWLEGSVSSMCINPARAFGPALMTGVWDNHWVFWTAPFLGGIPAALIYTQLFSEKALKAPASSGPQRAPPLQLQEWLSGSPQNLGSGSHLVLNFVQEADPSKVFMTEQYSVSLPFAADVALLSIYSGSKGQLSSLLNDKNKLRNVALDARGETMSQYGVTGHEAVLVTPTGHIAWRGNPTALEDAISQVLGGAAEARELLSAKTA
ncbi:g2567 [Coccomyxa viridis]|uniref:G2567 protein n=1 Tax=Coccomyxa viridis TaxID=1274662 RepID=A0ABP1FKQ0_9CHLO